MSFAFLATLAVLPLAVLCEDDVDSLCPRHTEWMGDGKKVVHDGVCYIFAEKLGDRHDASANCSKKFGWMAMPKTPEANEFLAHHMYVFGWKEAWLGLNDVIAEGKFRWADASFIEKDDYSNFANGNGVDRQGLGQFFFTGRDCVYLNADNKKWYDRPCSEQKHYICQY